MERTKAIHQNHLDRLYKALYREGMFIIMQKIIRSLINNFPGISLSAANPLQVITKGTILFGMGLGKILHLTL